MLELSARGALMSLSRVALPSVLLVDEGFGALDEGNLNRVAEALRLAVEALAPRRSRCGAAACGALDRNCTGCRNGRHHRPRSATTYYCKLEIVLHQRDVSFFQAPY